MTEVVRRTRLLTLLGLLTLLTVTPAFTYVARADQPPISYSFTIVGPNAAYAPLWMPMFGGDTMYITGSGSFACTTYYWDENSILHCTSGTVSGSGAYWIAAPDASVVDRGTWVLTSFISFTGYGGPNPGRQGGFLEKNAIVTSNIFGTLGEFYSSLSCTINAPAGAPPAGHTGGPFIEPVGGTPVFHLTG